MSTSLPRADVYTRVTARIIADLEAGVRPWLKPWKTGNTEGRITLPRRHNRRPYRGINILLLWGEAMAKGYSSSHRGRPHSSLHKLLPETEVASPGVFYHRQRQPRALACRYPRFAHRCSVTFLLDSKADARRGKSYAARHPQIR